MTAPSAERDREVARYLPFVHRTVHRLSAGLPPTVDREELFHAGVVGLLEALDRYDPEQGSTFLTFAALRIRGAVVEELRRLDPLSRGERQRLRSLRRTETELTARLGRPPSPSELADEAGVSAADLEQARQAEAVRFVSFEEIGIPPSGERRDLVEMLLTAENADAFTQVRIRELIRRLAQAVEALPEKERTVLALYYQEELTMKEIGAALEVSESRVSQLRSSAIRKLRDRMAREGWGGAKK